MRRPPSALRALAALLVLAPAFEAPARAANVAHGAQNVEALPPLRAPTGNGTSIAYSIVAGAPAAIVPMREFTAPNLPGSLGLPSQAAAEGALAMPQPARGLGSGPVRTLPSAQMAAPQGRAPWLGDYQDILDHGTPEQQAGLEEMVANGDVSLTFTGSEAERRALGIIRGITRDWTPRMLADDAAAVAPGTADLGDDLRFRLQANRSGVQTARARAPGPIEKLAWGARLVIAGLDPDPRRIDAASWAARLSRRTLGSRRALAEELVRRTPGSRLDRVLYGVERLRPPGSAAAGYALPRLLVNGHAEPGYTWHERGTWLKDARNISHELVHQTDAGYDRGAAALGLLFGDAGHALSDALREGETERRSLLILQGLYADGAAGEGGAAGRFYAEIHKKYRHVTSLSQAWQLWEEREFHSHPYGPSRAMAEAIAARPGGEVALAAYVARGDVAPLVALLGDETLRAMAVALAFPTAKAGPYARQAYVAMGFPAVFEDALAGLASGELSPDAAREAKRRSVALAIEASKHLRTQRQLDRLFYAGVGAAMEDGADDAALESLVSEALRPRRWDFLPVLRRLPWRAALLYGVGPAIGFVAAGASVGWWAAPIGAVAALAGADAWNAALALFAPKRLFALRRAGDPFTPKVPALWGRGAPAPAASPAERMGKAARALSWAPAAVTRFFGTGPYGQDSIGLWRAENPGVELPEDFVEFDVDEARWRESQGRPVHAGVREVKAEARFALLAGDVFANEYYKQHLDARPDGAPPVDAAWWRELIDSQPWLEWDARRGEYRARVGGAQERLLRRLRETSGTRVKLYRGTSAAERDYLRVIQLLGRGQKTPAAALAGAMLGREGLDGGLRRALEKAAAGRGSRRELLRVFAQASTLTWGNGALFTTPEAHSAQGFAKGTVLEFELGSADLERLGRRRALYAGVEFNYELAFLGEEGIAALADGLAGEIPLDASGGKIMGDPEGPHPIWGAQP